jgi:hypothetical protein
MASRPRRSLHSKDRGVVTTAPDVERRDRIEKPDDDGACGVRYYYWRPDANEGDTGLRALDVVIRAWDSRIAEGGERLA